MIEKERTRKLIHGLLRLCEWQAGNGHPATCGYCGHNEALIPFVLRTSGTDPTNYLAFMCPECGDISRVPRGWKFVTDEEDLLW